jgi:acyl-CoA reductase-like NAD-dependent aldehyde dehydrogenase
MPKCKRFVMIDNSFVSCPSRCVPVEVNARRATSLDFEAANRTMDGLTSTILAGSTYRAFEVAPKILAGIVNANSPTVNDEIHAPMGGVRDSGRGRTGPGSLKEFQDVIWINSHGGQRQYPN